MGLLDGLIPLYRGAGKRGYKNLMSTEGGVHGDGVYFYTEPSPARSHATSGGGVILGYAKPEDVALYGNVAVLKDPSKFIEMGKIPVEDTLSTGVEWIKKTENIMKGKGVPIGLMGATLTPSNADAQPIDLRVAGKRFMGLKNPTQQEAANFTKEMGGARGLMADNDTYMWGLYPPHNPVADALNLENAKRLVFESPAEVNFLATKYPNLFNSIAGADYKPSSGASRSFGTPLQNFENGVMPEGSPITYQQLIDLVTGTVTPFKGLLR